MVEAPLGQWLAYRDCLPLRVELPGGVPSQAQSQHWHDQNMRLLHAVAVLDDRHQHIDTGGKALEDEVERLHQKLDVVLELLGVVLRANRSDVCEQPVRLSREGLCWPAGDEPLAEGTAVVLHLSLHPCAPFQFIWPAQVVGCYDGEVCARFEPMGDALSAAIERFVFTRHRRSVAGARSPGGTPTA